MNRIILEASNLMPNDLKKTEKKKEKAKINFLSLLQNQENKEIEDDFINENVQEQIENIIELGQKLKKRISQQNILNYKNSVKNFLKAILKNVFTVEEKLSSRNILNQKKYTIIKVVDKKLDNLVVNLLLNQSKELNIMHSLEEIQGLLINLMH